jgi:hypothetical protein
MRIMTWRSFLPSCGLVFSLAVCGSAQAGLASGWWGGNWTCDIDGRPAQMQWSVVDAGESSCRDTSEGRICTSTSAVRWKGRFSDHGAAWVALTNPREGSRGGLYFRHADGNQWYLPKPTGGRTTGWTTWNGRRYRLSCWK